MFSGVAYFAMRNFPRVAKTSSFVLLGVSGIGAVFAGLSVLIAQKSYTYQSG